MRASVLTLACVASFSLLGCSDKPPKKEEPSWELATNNQLIPANYKAADDLLAQLKTAISKSQPLIIATVVNIDNLEQSSTLGRLISEQVAGRFTQVGYRMVEMKFRNNVYIKRNQGEMMLTREIKDLAQSHDAQAVIVGTYGQSDDLVFVNLKVIEPNRNIVLASKDYAIPNDASAKALLRAR